MVEYAVISKINFDETDKIIGFTLFKLHCANRSNKSWLAHSKWSVLSELQVTDFQNELLSYK